MAPLSPFLSRHRTAMAMMALAALAVAIAFPLFLADWHRTHDELRYLVLHEQFKEAVRHGILYPRWLPFFYGGYGYPTFVFYQPGFFYLTLALNAVIPDTMVTVHVAVTLLFFAGGVGVFLLISENRKVTTAWFCASLFMLTPYLFVNTHVRGDLSEFFSITLTPWPLYFLARLNRAVKDDAITWPWLGATAAALAGIMVAHPFTAMFYYPLFCAVALGWALATDRSRCYPKLVLAAAAMVLALVLSSPYWLPVLSLKGQVQYVPAVDNPENQVATHMVLLRQLFSRYWGLGISELGPDDTMSFQLGLPHFLLAILGVMLAWRRQRIFLLYGVIYAGLIFMTQAVSLPIWENVPYLRYVQFPWRILSVTAVVHCLCASGIEELANSHFRRVYAVSLPLILVAVLCWQSNQFKVVKNEIADCRVWLRNFPQERMRRFYVYAACNEFLPVTARTMMPVTRLGRPLVEVDHLDCVIAEYSDHTAFQLHYRVQTERPLRLTINQLYFPGWRVIHNGRRLTDAELRNHLLPDGRMEIPLDPGTEHELLAWYDGPPGWLGRNVAVALALLLYIGFAQHESRSKAATKNGSGNGTTFLHRLFLPCLFRRDQAGHTT